MFFVEYLSRERLNPKGYESTNPSLSIMLTGPSKMYSLSLNFNSVSNKNGT